MSSHQKQLSMPVNFAPAAGTAQWIPFFSRLRRDQFSMSVKQLSKSVKQLSMSVKQLSKSVKQLSMSVNFAPAAGTAQ